MQGMSVRLAHASPGRIRLKVDDVKMIRQKPEISKRSCARFLASTRCMRIPSLVACW